MITVGDAIYTELQNHDDHAVRNPEFYVNNDGSHTEEVIGTKGKYVATNTTGSWEAYFYPFKQSPVQPENKPVVMAVQGNVEGMFTHQPYGIICHATRSGTGNSEIAELYATLAYVRQGANGLGWHATVAPNLLVIHLKASEWAWNARETSRDYLAIEFAQAKLGGQISDDSLRAAAYWIKHYALQIWPKMPLNIVHHSELPTGKRDGKTDIFEWADTKNIQTFNAKLVSYI